MFALTFAATLFYGLSYPPYLAVRYEKPGPVTIGVMGAHYDFDEEYFANYNHAFYAPVEWVIDHTPVEKPLIEWATVWNVQEKVRHDSLMRSIPNWDELKTRARE